MKFYIAWKPTREPDVKYWDWFQPDAILVSLAKLLGSEIFKEVLAKGLHEYLGFRGEIFLDGGAYGYPDYLPPYTQTECLGFQSWLRADLVSHLDRPFVGLTSLSESHKWSLLRATIENARVASHWENNASCKVVLTVQGWDFESTTYCAEMLSELGAGHYALGSLIGVQTQEAVRRIVEVRQILGKRPKLHIFGVSRISLLERVRHLVDSFDSAVPAKAAAFKEIVNPFLRRSHVDEVTKRRCYCPVCRENPSLILAKGLPTQMKKFDHYRAIHNAYNYTEYARRGLS